MAENLWELESEVNDARDLLRRALDKTCSFLSDHQTGEVLPWAQMAETQTRLGNALAILDTALEPIAVAIQEEREHLDHMSDLADGASY